MQQSQLGWQATPTSLLMMEQQARFRCIEIPFSTQHCVLQQVFAVDSLLPLLSEAAATINNLGLVGNGWWIQMSSPLWILGSVIARTWRRHWKIPSGPALQLLCFQLSYWPESKAPNCNITYNVMGPEWWRKESVVIPVEQLGGGSDQKTGLCEGTKAMYILCASVK